MDFRWDCIVVGGGAAGLSAALVLGRARQRTLVIDAGEPSNRFAHGIGGLLGHDTAPPAALYAAGREELAQYPSVELRDGEAVGGEALGAERVADEGASHSAEGSAAVGERGAGGPSGFALTLGDGTRETARRVLLASGMDYDYPDVPGLAEGWGRSVFHCPFCHGWEVRERPLGVLDAGASGVHRALLLRVWSDDVTLYANGPAGLTAEEAAQLEAANVNVDERRVEELRGDDDLATVAFADGDERACEGMLVPVTLRQRSSLATQLGAATADPGPLAADAVAIDENSQTSVPGLFAAGDLGAEMPSVANAVAAGSNAAAAIVRATVGM